MYAPEVAIVSPFKHADIVFAVVLYVVAILKVLLIVTAFVVLAWFVPLFASPDVPSYMSPALAT